MHTNSVLCRLFADLVHTLSSVIVFHSNEQRDRRGAVGPFFEGEGAEVAVNWPPPSQALTPLWAMLRQRRAPPPPPRLSTRVSRAKRRGRSSIGYRRRRLRGCKTRGGGFTQGQAEASRHEKKVRRRGIGRGRGQGLGARAAEGASASSGPGQAGRGARACVRGETRGSGRGERACMRVG